MNGTPVEFYIPVYGTFTVYANGSREKSDERDYATPGMVSLRPEDWFAFTIGAVADVTDEDIQQLADSLAPYKNMRDLHIGGCRQLTGRIFDSLSAFDQLEEFNGPLASIRSRDWLALERFKNLTNLQLEGCDTVDDRALKVFAQLPRLEVLNLNLCHLITDIGVEYLSRSKSLVSLSINTARVTDRGIESLMRLRDLRWLALGDCRITDRSMVRLSELQKLEYMTLPNCAGLFSRLINGYGISRKGLAKFCEAKPDCYIWSEERYEAMQRMIDAA